MKYLFTLFLCIVLFKNGIHAQENAHPVITKLDQQYAKYSDIALKIWEYAEVGYQEFKSSALLQQTLQDAGFKVTAGVAGMPTAFIAEAGSGSPVIGILGEFDALPGVSQTAAPERQPREGAEAGHACGHHLFGTASAAAAIAIKSGSNHQVQVAPSGIMVRLQKKVVAERYIWCVQVSSMMQMLIHWHPSNANGADAASSLANISAKFRFYGAASHASGAPQLDARHSTVSKRWTIWSISCANMCRWSRGSIMSSHMEVKHRM
jgi:aminobenzoyl-glutamate utilization protein B